MKWAAMLRGINLGKRQLKKDELVAAAEACGYTGARTLLERIEASADAVCGGVASPLTQAERRDYLDCRDEAIRGAVAKMGAPRLKTLASRRRRELFAAR